MRASAGGESSRVATWTAQSRSCVASAGAPSASTMSASISVCWTSGWATVVRSHCEGARPESLCWWRSSRRRAVFSPNTLGAEIDIAVRSTIIRKINGAVLTGERELIDCGQYGDPDRNSDPHIGAQVNMIARKDAFVAIANPVALYIAGFAPLGWQTPDGSDPKDFWKIVRGDAAHGLRAVYEVPAREDAVSEIGMAHILGA